MRGSATRAGLSAVLLGLMAGTATAAPPARPLKSAIESSLPAERGQGLALALDGLLKTGFTPARPPGPLDELLLTFSGRVEASRLLAITGRPDGSLRLDQAVLELSEDGESFPRSAPFEGGIAHFDRPGSIRAIRVRFLDGPASRFVLRELVIDSTEEIDRPEVVARVRVDTSEVPELAPWAREAKDLCEGWYPIIARLLPSDGDGYTPPNTVDLVFKKDMKGIAFASGATITLAADYVKAHPDDFGMVVHELTHVLQGYPPSRAGWLVEGIADHVRIVHFEPNAPRPRIDPDRASYRDAYKTTAMFLEWVEHQHDRQLVRRLNGDLRAGTYEDARFQEYTGKPLDDLWEEFRNSLRTSAP